MTTVVSYHDNGHLPEILVNWNPATSKLSFTEHNANDQLQEMCEIFGDM